MVTRKLRILPFKTFFILMIPPPPRSTLFPYTTLFRSRRDRRQAPRLGGGAGPARGARVRAVDASGRTVARSEEHTSELQSHSDLVCRLLLEKKKMLSGSSSAFPSPSMDREGAVGEVAT